MGTNHHILVLEDGTIEEALSNGVFKDVSGKNILLFVNSSSKEVCGFFKRPQSMQDIDNLIESLKHYSKERRGDD